VGFEGGEPVNEGKSVYVPRFRFCTCVRDIFFLFKLIKIYRNHISQSKVGSW